MKTLCYQPHWRSMSIRLFSEPPKQFFDRLDHAAARFVLLSNGSLWWGDGFVVLHADIIEATEDNATSLMAGMLFRSDGGSQWLVSTTGNCTNDQSLLRALTEWTRIETMLGTFRWIADENGE